MIYKKMQKNIKENFSLLKLRNSKDIDSIADICKKYEDLRLAVAFFDDSLYQDICVQTGRALSNLCFDIMKLDKIYTLENITLNDDFSGVEIFFLAHRGGLCNRLRAISSLKLLARKMGIPFSFSWSEIELCNGGPLPYKNSTSRLDSLVYRVKSKICKTYLADEPLTPWFYYSMLGSVAGYKSWNSFLDDYKVESQLLLDEIINSSYGSERIKDKLTAICEEPYLAVHIRRTDFVAYFEKKFINEKLPTVDDYIKWINKHYPSGNIYVSTDDIEVKLELENEFSGRIIKTDIDYHKSKIRQTKFDHALLDLAALSRGKKILPTPRSSFSEYASSISSGNIIKLWETE